MGLKTDTSFLKFLTMGALGVREVIAQLSGAGFRPIELERYCASNKIWLTKIKRLRLPDLLCVKTGLRIEVRAKSELKIKMSDAPTNPERTWDAGLRNQDVIAFIPIIQNEGCQKAAKQATFFSVNDLRMSVKESKLGQPKSASEGAERDRTWPAIIPSRNGKVKTVTKDKLTVELDGNERLRTQTYNLKGKNPYVRVGDKFKADISMLAGAPPKIAQLSIFENYSYNPLASLSEPAAVDRYAAVKALPHRHDLPAAAVRRALEDLIRTDNDERVQLEAAGSAAVLGSQFGQERIREVWSGNGRDDLRMEAVLILTEMGSPFAKQELLDIATSTSLSGNEIQQASVWGLGKSGLRAYDELVQFISHSDNAVALHAIVGFGDDTPVSAIRRLVDKLVTDDRRQAAAASEALRLIGTEEVARVLAQTAMNHDWIWATLGRLPAEIVRTVVRNADVMERIRPMLLLSEGANWLANEEHVMDIAFLKKQCLS